MADPDANGGDFAITVDSAETPENLGEQTADMDIDFKNLANEMGIGRSRIDRTVFQETKNKQAVLFEIRTRQHSHDRDTDSESVHTDSEDEEELQGLELPDNALLDRQISETHNLETVDVPELPLRGSHHMQRTESLVNIYLKGISDDVEETDDLDPDLLDCASPRNNVVLPSFVTEMNHHARSSLLRLASRTSTNETANRELTETFEISEQQASDVLKFVKKQADISGDLITTVDFDIWHPAAQQFEYFQFTEDSNSLKKLKISGEFFRFLRRHFTENDQLVDTLLPDLREWTDNTYKFFTLRGRNNVTNITSALESALYHTQVLRDFLEYSFIIFEEDLGENMDINFNDTLFGQRQFAVGQFSVVAARSFFSFTSHLFTFRQDVWEEALDTQVPGKILMVEPVFCGQGVNPETARRAKQFDTLQRLNHLFLAEYISTVGLLNVRSRNAHHPIVFSFKDMHMLLPASNSMLNPLKQVFQDTVYCLNPSPQRHIPDILKKYGNLEKCRIICDTVGWLHTLQYLINERVYNVVTLSTEITNWLARKKPKKPGAKNKSNRRVEVEKLQKHVDEEMNFINKLLEKLPKAGQFEEMYLEEQKTQINKARAKARREQKQRESMRPPAKQDHSRPRRFQKTGSKSKKFTLGARLQKG